MTYGAGYGNRTHVRGLSYAPRAASNALHAPPQRCGIAVYNHVMAKDVIHISEAVSDCASLMARVRSGAEVVIEGNSRPVAIVRPVAEPSVRLLSESLRLAREHSSTVTLDGDFGRDLEEIINSHREPLNPPA
jgi:antitoxin (DNA-binding transcriptional repressor) of toxin-antitoxin stability system